MDAAPYLRPFKQPYTDAFGIKGLMLQPESRGQVLLVSAEPTAAPLIRQNFLATERDRRTMREIIDPSPAACAERKRAVEDGEYEKLSTEVKDLHREASRHVGKFNPCRKFELHEHFLAASIRHPPSLGSAVSRALPSQCVDDDWIFDHKSFP